MLIQSGMLGRLPGTAAQGSALGTGRAQHHRGICLSPGLTQGPGTWDAAGGSCQDEIKQATDAASITG